MKERALASAGAFFWLLYQKDKYTYYIKKVLYNAGGIF
jgi:hypothetical protein